MPPEGREARIRLLVWGGVALLVALAVRLQTVAEVFRPGRVLLEGTDGYYHLRRAWLMARDWPSWPRVDGLLSVPDVGLLQWPPLFDLLLAAVAAPWPGSRETALETTGALLPVALGLVEIALLALVVRRLAGPRAALVSLFAAAVLPGVARYALVGALDHDPLVEIGGLLLAAGLVGALTEGPARPSIGRAVEVMAGCLVLTLTWAGSLIHLGLLGAASLAAGAAASRGEGLGQSERAQGERLRALASALGPGAGGAALVLLPFALASPWTQARVATFEGLSLLHVAALLALATAGCLVGSLDRGPRRQRWVFGAVLAGAPFLALLPWTAPAFLEGLGFLGRGEPFLEAVAESRPLLALQGRLDLRPLLVRCGLLPLLYPLLLPWLVARRPRDPRRVFLVAWAAGTLLVALVQARYGHGAALAAAAVGGVLAAPALRAGASRRRRSLTAAACALALLPCLPAYLPVPGFPGYLLRGRPADIVATGMDEVSEFLRSALPAASSWTEHRVPAGRSVLTPWAYGHWVIWPGRQGSVAGPFGPQGQPSFREGVRWYLLEDEAEAARLLDRHRVDHVVVQTDPPPLHRWARMARVDSGRFLTRDPTTGRELVVLDLYLDTVAGRLAYAGTRPAGGPLVEAPAGYREVFRTRRRAQTPFGLVMPKLRVYEVAASEELVFSPRGFLEANRAGKGGRRTGGVSAAQPPHAVSRAHGGPAELVARHGVRPREDPARGGP